MNRMQDRHHHQTRILVAIIGLAFFLRIWGIWNATSSDEYNEVFEALRVCSGNLNFERWFKRFYLYILALEYGLYFAMGWVMDLFQSPGDFAIKIVRDMEPLFILGRTTSAFLGTGSVLMTYLVGKILFNKNVGLLAALFLSLNVVNIELSHYARVDASLCFLVLTTFYCICRIYRNKMAFLLRWYLLAGLFLGCAIQNKPQAVILMIPFVFAHCSRYEAKAVTKMLFAKPLWFFGGGMLLGLLVGNPAIVFAPVKFMQSFMGLGKVYTTAVNMSRSEHIGFIAYGIYFLKEMGLLMACVAGYCLLGALVSQKSEMYLLLCFMVPFYILMGASRYMVSSSYMVPFMPFLYLVMASVLYQGVAARFTAQRSAVALVVISVVLLVQPIYNVVLFERSLSGLNTRTLARNWIEENIPFNSKILMDSGKTINSTAPKIAMNAASIERLLSAKKNEMNEGTLSDTTHMVDEKSLVYFELLLQTVPPESYDITSTGFGLDVKDIDYYIANNYEYFVIAEEMKRARTNTFFAKIQPEVADFYRALDQDKRLSLLHFIGPTPENRGNSFFIYKLNS